MTEAGKRLCRLWWRSSPVGCGRRFFGVHAGYGDVMFYNELGVSCKKK
jgi:hypothetical protein